MHSSPRSRILSNLATSNAANNEGRAPMSATRLNARRSRSLERSRTIRLYRGLSVALALMFVVATAAAAFYWQTSVSLERGRDAAQRDLRMALQAWNQVGMATQSTTNDPGQQDVRRMSFVANTLTALNHPYLMSVLFVPSSDAASVDVSVRLVNSGANPIQPQTRLELYDFLGNMIGEVKLDASNAVERGATRLLPNEMRLHRMQVPLKAGAEPAWFMIRWQSS